MQQMFDFSHFLTDTYAIVLAAILLSTLVYLCLYYGLYHMRVGNHHLKASGTIPDTGQQPPVSVVLTAMNNSAWLKDNLVYLLEQDYPDFEVVVVDYISQDDTQFVLKLLKDYYPHLKTVPFKEDVNLFQGKKYPLSIGIKSAKNDILMLADPDCVPQNPHWLSGMVKGYSNPETQIVIGYCGVKRSKNMLGWLQQYDILAYSAQYLGSALLGHPYTASGRNLSYRRSFFFRRGGFISHYDVAEGADDLFVYQNAEKGNTAVCIEPDACLTAEPLKTFAQWHEVRRRRVATRNRHSLRSRLHEALLPIANLLFYSAGALLIVGGSLPWIAVAIAATMKWIWQIVCFRRLSKRFDGGWIHWAAPLFEIYFILANTILILLPLQNNKKFK